MKWNVEYTDTFGVDANYCWVKRFEIEIPDHASNTVIHRRLKAALDLTGVKGTWFDCGDSFSFRPYRSNTVLFGWPLGGGIK